jgi:hypothetical protein
MAREAWSTYLCAKRHWASCARCRSAAQASEADWCDVGLRLMKARDVKHEHWRTCKRCMAADAAIRGSQCETGKDLDVEYARAVRRLQEALA